jgi:hypothetical protein
MISARKEAPRMLRPDREEFVRAALADGIFMTVKMRAWRAAVHRTLELPPAAMLELPPGRTSHQLHLRVPQLEGVHFARKKLDIALKTKSFRTVYGNFVPGKNIVPLLESFQEAKNDLFRVRDAVTVEYEAIMAEIEKQYQVVVEALWKEKYGHEGDPTPNFRNTLTRSFQERLTTAPEIGTILKFDVVPYRVVTDPSDPRYEILGGDAHATAVCRAVWDAILHKRRALVCIGLKFMDEIEGKERPPPHVFKRLFSKLGGYRDTVFYDDPELLRLIDAIRDFSIVASPLRTIEAGKALIQGMVDHVRNQPFFLVGPTP